MSIESLALERTQRLCIENILRLHIDTQSDYLLARMQRAASIEVRDDPPGALCLRLV